MLLIIALMLSLPMMTRIRMLKPVLCLNGVRHNMGMDIDIVSVLSGVVLPVFFEQPPPPEGTTTFSDVLTVSIANNNTVTKDKTLTSGKQCTITQTFGRLASTDTGNQDVLTRYIFQPGQVDESVFEIGRDIFGTAHPTGYPTYVILGFIANLLLAPLGATLWLSA